MNDKAIVPADQAGQAPQQFQTGQSLSLFDKIADPMKAIEQMGVFIAESGMFGKMNQNQGKVLAWHCLTKKKDPFEFKREYHILEDGQITKRADAMAADFIRRGGKIKWISDLNADDKAEATFFTRDGDAYTWSFSIKDAKGYSETRDGYLKKNWRDSTPDMLRARLISKSIRILDPEVNAGVYTPEELRDNMTVPVTPSPTGLFDQTAQTIDQIAPELAAPIQTTAEVVGTTPALAQPKMEEKPPIIDQSGQAALNLLPTTQSPAASKKELTVKEMFDVVIDRFKAFPSTSVDAFFVRKLWLMSGQCLMDLNEEHTKRAYKTLDQIIPIYKAWAKQQEDAAKKPPEGAVK
jgi:hypothetical protein